MANKKLSKDEKEAELKKYRDLIIATLDYYIENNLFSFKATGFDHNQRLMQLKQQTEEHFKKGRLTMLKHWFRDVTEPIIEGRDMNFNKYLNKKTNYGMDVFKSFFNRVDKVIEKGKITSDSQFYDLGIVLNDLCQSEPVDSVKIAVINKLLTAYEKSKS